MVEVRHQMKDTPSAPTLAWAQQLLAVEIGKSPAADGDSPPALRVSEKMRISLTRFVGADGFTSLIRRALALARAEAAALETVKITADGRLEGIEVLAVDRKTGDEAAITLIAHVLRLLVIFVGVSLTRQLVREIWPEASLEE
jgi:hypothetical protein